jgi:hypothetical protein
MRGPTRLTLNMKISEVLPNSSLMQPVTGDSEITVTVCASIFPSHLLLAAFFFCPSRLD